MEENMKTSNINAYMPFLKKEKLKEEKRLADSKKRLIKETSSKRI